MLFYSTNKKSPKVTFLKALMNGLAPDGGLYFPEKFPVYSSGEIDRLSDMSLQEIAIELLTKWTGDELNRKEIEQCVYAGLTFPIPLKKIGDTYIAELFHGPTLAFKDIAAGILGQLINTVLVKTNQTATILVATSGDTGAAVAKGCAGISTIKTVIVYPEGRISKLQEEQLTRAGDNTLAIGLNGDFDACQKYVKQAFLDPDLGFLKLASANSVNIGRLIPQSIYYFYAYAKLQKESLQFIVPSGNMGNVTAGLFAQKMGLPVQSFMIAVNDNRTVPDYLQTGIFVPKKTKHTISTAMDIGNPSNFSRILELFHYSHSEFLKLVDSVSIDTKTTIKTIQDVYQKYNYLLDPHTAVGFAASERMPDRTGTKIVLATASPQKFAYEISNATGISVDDSAEIALLQKLPKKKIVVENSYTGLKDALLHMH